MVVLVGTWADVGQVPSRRTGGVLSSGATSCLFLNMSIRQKALRNSSQCFVPASDECDGGVASPVIARMSPWILCLSAAAYKLSSSY